MPETIYRDLPQFGLPFVTPESAEFPALLRELQSRPQPLGPPPASDNRAAAILLNCSGKAIVALSYLWKYTTVDGQIQTSRYSNLGSSLQMDVLSGRAPVVRDRASFILPDSKRLITEHGLFGDNLDVLSPDSTPQSGGFVGTGASGLMRGERHAEMKAIELQLDTVFFEDGLCVGPDESGLFESIAADLDLQRSSAQQVIDSLRNGASLGEVFEILRPLARRAGADDRSGRHLSGHLSSLLPMFARMAINCLVNMDGPQMLPWFEQYAQASSIQLHRPKNGLSE